MSATENVFDFLGIQPTWDFKIVRKAYLQKELELHPFKASDEDRPALILEFRKPQELWAQVREPDLLNNYYEQPVFPARKHAPFPNPKVANAYTAIERVNVFIPVPLSHITSYDRHKIDQTTFFKNLDLSLFANYAHQNHVLFIGKTRLEACEILSLHKIWEAWMIMEAQVSLYDISSERFSELELTTALNAKSAPYYLLRRNTQISKQDIISITPVRLNEFLNSNAGSSGLDTLKFSEFAGYYKSDNEKNLNPTNQTIMLALTAGAIGLGVSLAIIVISLATVGTAAIAAATIAGLSSASLYICATTFFSSEKESDKPSDKPADISSPTF